VCGGVTPYVRHSTDCTCCDFGHLRFLGKSSAYIGKQHIQPAGQGFAITKGSPLEHEISKQ
jgi:hypothetical protein